MWIALAATLLILIISGLVFRRFTQRPYLTVGWLWYLGTLVPVIGLVQVGTQSMADRYTYIPLIGIYIMIAWSGQDLIGRWPTLKVSVIWGTVVVMLVLVMVTWRNVSRWQDSYTLFDHVLRVDGRNALAQLHRGLASDHDREQALTAGNADVARRKEEESLGLLLRAVQFNPTYGAAHNNASAFYARRESRADKEKALHFFQRAVECAPKFADAYNNLGVVHQQLENFAEAETALRTALQLKPHDESVHSNLGGLYARQFQLEQSAAAYEQAIELNPQSVGAHRNLGIVLRHQGRVEDARHHLEMAAAASPLDADLHNERGIVNSMLGRQADAIKCFEQALRADPGHEQARQHLAQLYAFPGSMLKANGEE